MGLHTGWGKFIESLVEHGFPETDLPEDSVNFEPIIGTRVRFIQQKNEAATAKYGKRKAKSGNATYDRTDVVVAQVYETSTSTGKPNGGIRQKTTTKPSALGAKNKKDSSDRDLADLADETLQGILGDKDGTILRRGLSLEVTKRLMKHAQRDAVRELMYSNEYLAGAVKRGLIAFDQKTQTITAA